MNIIIKFQAVHKLLVFHSCGRFRSESLRYAQFALGEFTKNKNALEFVVVTVTYENWGSGGFGIWISIYYLNKIAFGSIKI